MASLEKKFGRSAASRGETGLLSDGAVESTAIAIVLLHSRAATSSIIWCDENFQVLVSKSMSQLVGTAECPLWLDDQFEESGRFREAWKVRAEYEGLIKASCGDGPIWLKARLTRKLNQDGNLEQLIGVFIDVTFQIDQAFEHRLLRQTFAQMPLSIAIRDRRLPGSPVIFANQAAADIAHLALSDVIGKSAMTYQVKNQDSEIARNMRDCLAKGVIASGVLEARRRD
jgi:PAS domain-containing protein